jgi:plasmid stabilization system protein ParE
MMPRWNVRYTPAAKDDLWRLFDFLLDQAQTAEDFDRAQQALDAITHAVEHQLSRNPFMFRKAGSSPFLRELVIGFGRSGYVALYDIESEKLVTILAVRHQLEGDYH